MCNDVVFSEHCWIIAGVEPEMLLKAIALKGEESGFAGGDARSCGGPKVETGIG